MDMFGAIMDHVFCRLQSVPFGCARMADDVQRQDLDLFLKALGARGFGRPLERRCAEIIEAAIAEASKLPRPMGKQLSDVILQQSYHLTKNLGLAITVPEFDNVPVNRP